MRPVARIAQSVEQGIENPRVLGSIPSPGTIFRRTRLWRVFCFLRQDYSLNKFDRTTLLRIEPGRKLPQFFREDLAQRNQFIRCLLQLGTGLNRMLHAQTGTAAF